MYNNILIQVSLITAFILFVIGAIVKSQSLKNIIFFVISLILFIAIFEIVKNISKTYSLPKGFQQDCPSYAFLILAGFIYVTLIVVIFNLLGLGTKENYRMLEINPVYKCVSGPYTWGAVDSPLYQYCSKPEVQEALAKINCGKEFVGRRINWNNAWDYTSQSNDEWGNSSCTCLKNGDSKCNSTCNCLNKIKSDTGVL